MTPKEFKYGAPFDYAKMVVYPERMNRRETRQRTHWWLHARPSPRYRELLEERDRILISPSTAKHRIFVWISKDVLADHSLLVFARDDDYFFGVLHSRLHESWALRSGTWLGKGNDPRYTPTTTFETFPFPWLPGKEPGESEDERVAEIAHWARELVDWRDAWLNPPREGMYAGMGGAYEKMVKKRTLTNLYNGLVYYRQTVKDGEPFLQAEFDKVTRKSISRDEIQELDDIHTALDQAVLDAYGRPHDLSDEEILARLLALNLERAILQEPKK